MGQAINENPCQSVFTDVMDTCDKFITGVIPHCTQNLMDVLPEMKLLDLVPNSYNHVTVNDLYIPWNSLPICLQQIRQANPGNI